MKTQIFRLTFLVCLSGIAFFSADALDLETIIAEMKHYDSSVISANGDFVIERHRGSEVERTEYMLTFEGKKVRVERGSLFVEIYDGERHWEIYNRKKHLFDVEVAPGDMHRLYTGSELPIAVQQAFNQQSTEFFDDVHIARTEQKDSFTVTMNEAKQTYLILKKGLKTFEVYNLYQEYRVRHQWRMPSDLDPRYWLTFSSAGENTYLTKPLWRLLEKHKSTLLGREMLNGEETSVIRLNLPAQSFKVWILHGKGFCPVKLERTFTVENPTESSPFKAGGTYVERREIDYHEHLPEVWFPKRVEQSIAPLITGDPQRIGEIIRKTVVLTKACWVNTDVTEHLRLDVSPDTPVFDYEVEQRRPAWQVIPEILHPKDEWVPSPSIIGKTRSL